MTWATSYRPTSFGANELVGQANTHKILVNMMKRYGASGRDWKKMPSCLILVGSHGSGKTTIGRIVTRHLNCEEGPVVACGKCKNCVDIAAGRFRDLKEFDAASNRGVNDANSLKELLDFGMVGKVRVVLLDEAHMLTKEAWASWLKTMEEGKANTLFILATTDSHKIPETIYSRAMTFYIKTVKPEEAAPRLIEIAHAEGFELSEEAAQTASFLSNGHMRDSIQLLETSSLLVSEDNKEITVSDLYEAAGLASVNMAKQFVDLFFMRDFQGLIEFLASCPESPSALLKSSLQYIHAGLREINNDMAAIPLSHKICLLDELGQAAVEVNQHGLPTPFLVHYYKRFLKAIGEEG
ncbi:AAA family ATPase [Salmonella enterica]|nr:AAA family ATPase [Salmonella enterica]